MENQEHAAQKDQPINTSHGKGEKPTGEGEANQNQMAARNDDAGYTQQEDQFADGKGTQLNEEIAPDRGDIEDELSEATDDDFAAQQFSDEQLDEDFERFKSEDKA
ncbi:MAG: hypothetical protein EOO07_16800 [Chitinophagaceae bacterium]|nr:MAG: hypothetical protein EOO07_16800 [Chitinophagaceae bacterium]